MRIASKLEHPLALVALLALVSSPFVAAKYPPASDYYSHVGGFYVMLHKSELAHYYHFEWDLVGNLGSELFVAAAGPFLGVENAGRLLFALVPALTTAGLLLLSRQAHGRIQPTVLFSLPLIYGFPFNYGFLNYCLGIAVAFLAAAAWIGLRERPLVQAVGGTFLAGVVWIAHFAAFGVFLVLITSYAFVSTRSLRRTIGLVAPALWPLLLTVLWRAGSGSGGMFFAWEWKPHWIADFLRSEWKWFDRGSAAFILCAAAILFSFWVRERRSGTALVTSGAALLGLFLILPDQVFGSTFTDARLVPPALMLLLTGLTPPSRHVTAVTVIGAAFVILRLLYVTATWQTRSTEIEAELRVIDRIPSGSRIAVLAYASGCEGWPMFGPDHIPSLAIPRRQAFVNTLWDQAGAALVQPIYNRGLGFNGAGSGGVKKPGSLCVGEPLDNRLKTLPRDRFDFLWSFVGPVRGFRQVAHGQRGILYRID